ncbi:MAG TPA: ABC transporter ATP-binding protein [Candidatus Binatia bacterium]|nr:ABC transporter ATP-binding protein [Candidatus Binatia bacterium]
MSPVIKLTGVTKLYDMGEAPVRALNGIDLEIARGEYVGVMGPSGSGKTTLMDVLGCLSRPTTGTYEFGGQRVDQLDEAGLAQLRGERIGFVFQAFNLLPRLSAVENVELPLLYRRVPRAGRRRRALELLDRVGLSARARHRPAELSGGERQRVAIARALVNQPAVVLADEPTGALDTATGDAIMDLIESLNHEGHTVVVVTHDPRIGDRVTRQVRLRDGVVESDVTRTAKR